MYNLCFYGIRRRFKAIPVIPAIPVTQKRAGKSILLDLFPLFRTILYDRHIPIQTLINITLLRNVMLTAPFGAWATCGLSTDSMTVSF